MKKSHRSTETRYELSTNKISPSIPPPFPRPPRFLVIDATSSVNFSSWITGDRLTKLAEQFFVRRRVDESTIPVYIYIHIYKERECISEYGTSKYEAGIQNSVKRFVSLLFFSQSVCYSTLLLDAAFVTDSRGSLDRFKFPGRRCFIFSQHRFNNLSSAFFPISRRVDSSLIHPASTSSSIIDPRSR